MAERLASLFDASGDAARAADYHELAAAKAATPAAYRGALTHVERALAALARLPATPARRKREMNREFDRSSIYGTLHSFADPDYGRILTRAAGIAEELADDLGIFRGRLGTALWKLCAGDVDEAVRVCEAMLSTARTEHPEFLAGSCVFGAWVFSSRGDYGRCLALSEEGLAALDGALEGIPLRVHKRTHLLRTVAAAHFGTGAVETGREARNRCLESLAESRVPADLSTIPALLAVDSAFVGDRQSTGALAEQALAGHAECPNAANERLARALQAWTRCDGDTGDVERLAAAVDAPGGLAMWNYKPFALALLADEWLRVGEPHRCLDVVGRAFELPRFPAFDSELWRVRGQALATLAQGTNDAAMVADGKEALRQAHSLAASFGQRHVEARIDAIR